MTDERGVQREIARTLADRLLAERIAPATAHLVLLGIVTALVWGSLPRGVLAAWATAVVAVVLVRLVLWQRARTRRIDSATAVMQVRATMLAAGLVWGLGTAIAAQYLPLVTTVVIVMGLAGLLAGAIATLVADLWAFRLYLGTMLGLVLIGMGVTSDSLHEGATLILIVAFVAFLWREHSRGHAGLVAGLRAEQLLRDRERQLVEAQTIAHVGSWEADLATNLVTWSDEAYRIFGIPLGTTVSYDDFVARIHPDDRGRVERIVSEGIARRHDVEYEWRLVRPDGDVRVILGRNVCVVNGDGQVVRLAGTTLDITERKKAEEALTAALLELRTLRGYLRVCANCRRVLAEDGTWEQLESYVRQRTEAEFSHGICPDCAAQWADSGEFKIPKRARS